MTNDIWAIIGVNIGLIASFTTIIVYMMNRIDSDVKGLSTRIDSLSTRMDGHATRIDQLYMMFVDLLKETKK